MSEHGHDEPELDSAVVRLTFDELTILIGGVRQALLVLGEMAPDEFAIRVGPTEDEAEALIRRLKVIRDGIERRSQDPNPS